MIETFATTLDDTTSEIEFEATIVNYFAFANHKLRQSSNDGGRLVVCWDQQETQWKECIFQAKRKELKAWTQPVFTVSRTVFNDWCSV